MLGDVLEAAVIHDDDVRLVTDDAAAAAAARALGADVIADPGGGQGAAVEAALLGAEGACLVVNADLPCLTAAALARLAELAPAHVPAPDGTTNALALPDRTWFRPPTAPAALPASPPRASAWPRSSSSSTTSTRSTISSSSSGSAFRSAGERSLC